MGASSSNIRDTMASCNENDFTMKYCNESLSRANKQIVTAVYETSDDNWLKGQFDKNKIKTFLSENFANDAGWSEFNFKRLSHPRIDTNIKDTYNDKDKTKTREDDDHENALVNITWSSHVLKNVQVCFLHNPFHFNHLYVSLMDIVDTYNDDRIQVIHISNQLE